MGHSCGLFQRGHLTKKKLSLLVSLQLPQHIILLCGTHQPGQVEPCLLAPSTEPTTGSSAPHQPFTSPRSWIPEVQPDSRRYLLISHSKTQAKGEVGQSFWPGSPSRCSPRSRLLQQRTQQLALPQGFQPAKIPTQNMFPRWSLSTHPLSTTVEFPADSINHPSGMWSCYFPYSPVDTLRFPEESAPNSRGHLQLGVSDEKATEILNTDTILIN